MVRNRIFWTIGEQTYFVYYPIISYRKINVYRFETIDMGRSHWNNGVSGTITEDQVIKSEGIYFHQRFTRSNICKD